MKSNPDGITVLSLFDGMSCGQIALERAGIKVSKYFASEIDKHAIAVTMRNYPDTIQLGSVTDVRGADLPKIDLLMGGSPCQGFSIAGKQLNFDDPRSKLFFEFVRLLKETQPRYFLLENVRMKKEYQDIISNYLGIEPIMIDSALVSAQSRKRLYWTSIGATKDLLGYPVCGITQPEDKGILLKDIVHEYADSPMSNSQAKWTVDVKAHILSGCKKKQVVSTHGRDLVFIPVDKHSSSSGLICIGALMQHGKKLWVSDGKHLQHNFSQGYRVYSSEGKATALSAQQGGLGGRTGLYEIAGAIRKLTPVECERLQTVPDNYTAGVSKAQRYKMLGNGWTVDVIAHILSGMQNGE